MILKSIFGTDFFAKPFSVMLGYVHTWSSHSFFVLSFVQIVLLIHSFVPSFVGAGLETKRGMNELNELNESISINHRSRDGGNAPCICFRNMGQTKKSEKKQNRTHDRELIRNGRKSSKPPNRTRGCQLRTVVNYCNSVLLFVAVCVLTKTVFFWYIKTRSFLGS